MGSGVIIYDHILIYDPLIMAQNKLLDTTLHETVARIVCEIHP